MEWIWWNGTITVNNNKCTCICQVYICSPYAWNLKTTNLLPIPPFLRKILGKTLGVETGTWGNGGGRTGLMFFARSGHCMDMSGKGGRLDRHYRSPFWMQGHLCPSSIDGCKYSRTCLIRHTVGPKNDVRLDRMSEYSGFFNLYCNRNIEFWTK